MRKKIGILGGTFDPFHKGHLMLAQTAYEQFDLDEVWILPNGNPPHKKELQQTDFSIRCEMIRLAIKKAPYMKLCKVEEREDRYHYTYQTLEYFHNKYPETKFYFIIGADSLRDFPTWREPGRILELCTLLAACRDEEDISVMEGRVKELLQMYPGEILLMNSPKVDAASKEIRKMVSEGKEIFGYVGDEEAKYIEKLHLYEKDSE